MRDPLWLDPASITHKISPVRDLVGIQPGDWDTERRYLFIDTTKARSIRQHLVEGRAWVETDLFADVYRRRMADEGHIRGHRTLAALAESYGRIDQIAQSMKQDGFMLGNGRGKQYPLPALLVGRDGQVFIGNQGNHRLAIAQVLGLDRIAGEVVCRHRLAA